jgi:rare lipoprotein A
MPKRRSRVLPLHAVMMILTMLSACGGKHVRTSRPAVPNVAGTARVGDTQTGIASWYGDPYHGRIAANGEVYDMDAFTAAHQTLPFEIFVRVTNLTNNKTVDVRITDRGPFVEGRIIDLSRAAAREIDMIGPGTARVRLEVIQPTTQNARVFFYSVQVGAFQDRSRAEVLRGQADNVTGGARIMGTKEPPHLYRVLVARESVRERAEELAQRLRAEGFTALVVRLDE